MTATLTNTRLREPGLVRLPPGMERYRVRGGGAIAFRLFEGDRLTVRDREGLQTGHLAAFSASGKEDLAALNVTSQVVLTLPAAGQEEEVRLMMATLAAHKIDA